MARDPRYINSSKTIAMHVFPGLVLQVFSGPVTREHLQQAQPMFDHPSLGEHHVELVRVAPTALSDIPDDAFRKFAAQSVQKRAHRLVATGFVVAGEGFFSSLARTVITGVSLLARANHAEKVFSEPFPAAAWLTKFEPANAMTPMSIVTALDELIGLTR